MGDWRERARCSRMPKHLFFPVPVGMGQAVRDDDERWQPALGVCERCPVTAECLEANLLEVDGVWGGTIPRVRAVIRRERGIAIPRKRPGPRPAGERGAA